jgi:hypothetical protein
MSGLGIRKLSEKKQMNKTNWLEHVESIEDYILLECILNYMALGRRGVERPRKR